MSNKDTKESDLKYANLAASYVMTVNQPTQLSQAQAELSLQYSKSYQLYRQKFVWDFFKGYNLRRLGGQQITL